MGILLSIAKFLVVYYWALFAAEAGVTLLAFYVVWRFKPSALSAGSGTNAENPDAAENERQNSTLEKKRRDLDKWRR